MDREGKNEQAQHSYQPTRLPDAFSLFRPSWEAFRLNWPVFIVGFVLPFIILAILIINVIVAIPNLHSNSTSVYGSSSSSISAAGLTTIIIASLLAILFACFYSVFFYYIKLQSAKGVKLRFWTSFKSSLHYFWRLLGLVIARFLIVIVGLILLVVPGLFMIRRYILAPYYLIDEDLSITEAMRRSADDSKIFSSALWALMGLYVLVFIASAILNVVPFVGWIVSFGISLVTLCLAAARYTQVKLTKR